MAKKKSNEKKIIILSVTLTIAVFLLIVCVLILVSDSNRKNIPSSGGKVSFLAQDSSMSQTVQTDASSEGNPAESSLSDSSENQDTSSEIVQVILEPASSLIELSSLQLAEKLGEYSNYGQVNGGFTIYNYDVIPNMDFAVSTDENFKILDEYLWGIVVHSGGKITQQITVGMTYDEMKLVIGEKLQPIEQAEESCMFAIINEQSFTATIEFEYSGGKSIAANVMLK